MNRKEAAELLPIIKAFSEGKDIEMRSKNPHAQLNGWAKMDEFIFGNFEYRIKPEPKYRPFKDTEECWDEMKKHHPFGWVKSTLFKDLALVKRITTLYIEINRDIIDYKDALEKFTFADDAPFGVKEEE